MFHASNTFAFLTSCAFTLFALPFSYAIWNFSSRCFPPWQDRPWWVGRVIMLVLSLLLYVLFFGAIGDLCERKMSPEQPTSGRAMGLGAIAGTILFVFTIRDMKSERKKRATDKWEEKEIPEIVGQGRDIMVRCRPFPYRKKQNSSKRYYAYPDFGADLRHELMDVQLQDWGELSTILSQNGEIDVHVKLEQCKDILVHIQCEKLPTQQQFFSDLSDAIIDAMKKNNIRT